MHLSTTVIRGKCSWSPTNQPYAVTLAGGVMRLWAHSGAPLETPLRLDGRGAGQAGMFCGRGADGEERVGNALIVVNLRFI